MLALEKVSVQPCFSLDHSSKKLTVQCLAVSVCWPLDTGLSDSRQAAASVNYHRLQRVALTSACGCLSLLRSCWMSWSFSAWLVRSFCSCTSRAETRASLSFLQLSIRCSFSASWLDSDSWQRHTQVRAARLVGPRWVLTFDRRGPGAAAAERWSV